MLNHDTNEKTKKKEKTTTSLNYEAQLIVYNDDYNSFDYVIKCFVEICKITSEKAEQIALAIHFRGLEVVKSGEFEEMRKMKNQLIDCGLSAVVQQGKAN